MDIDIYSMMNWFDSIGGFDIILPFLLIFTVCFAILQKIKLFGEPDKSKPFNLVISLVIAFFLVIQEGLVAIIHGFLPRVAMLILVMLMILLITGIFAGGAEWSGSLLGIAAIISIIAVLWAIAASAGWSVPLLDWFTEQDVAVLIVIGVFVLVIWLIVKEPGKKEGHKGLGDWLKSFGEQVKKR